jgi:hypothetical protein
VILIDVRVKRIHLSSEERSLATAASAREALRLEFLSQISASRPAYQSWCQLRIDELVLKRMIVKYSEQLVYRPLEEVMYWFAYSSGAFLEPGYPPLFYSRSEHKAVSPNKSAVAGIGEGVAGLIGQQLYKCRKLARPNHDYPDIVMEGNHRTYLIESKATLTAGSSEIESVIEQELVRFASYISSCAQLDNRVVVGLLVGTALMSETSYSTCITEIIV